MPSGTGKTVSLLSLIVSYQQVRSPFPQLHPPRADTPTPVLPYQTKVNLLLPYRSRDRKGPGRAEAAHGVPHTVRRDARAEGEGGSVHGVGPDQSEEPVHPPGGVEGEEGGCSGREVSRFDERGGLREREGGSGVSRAL